eukprot:302957_1
MSDESQTEEAIATEQKSEENTNSNSKKQIDFDALKLSLKDIDTNSSKYKNIPLSAPTKLRQKRRIKNQRNPPHSAREMKSQDPFTYTFKRTIPYTPRLDELPLSLRLHSNPMILLQSLRRQKISNYNMYHAEPAIDNKPSKQLRKYSNRRRKLRESNDPFPNMP